MSEVIEFPAPGRHELTELTALGQKDYEKLPLIGFRPTDTGNAQRLATRWGEVIRYCHPMRAWLCWDGKRWARDTNGKVMRLAFRTVRAIYPESLATEDKELAKALWKHAVKSESANALTAMVKLASNMPSIPVPPEDLDSNPWLLNVENGTIDLRTGKLREHRQSDLITKLTRVEYDPSAESEVWFKFLADVTGGDTELAAYIRTAVGYALQGKVSEKAFWFLYGPPDGGKSTFMNAIGGMLGEYYSVANSDTWIVQSHAGGNRGDLVRLRAARLVGSVEIRKGSKLDEALVKGVTGGDMLTASAKYQEEISFLPSFALWMAGNDAPEIRDDDEGSWSRVRRIPFTCPVPKAEQNARMGEELAQEAVRRAILAWAVSGCLEWQKRGMGQSQAVVASSEAYRGECDRTAGFFDECCVFAAVEKIEPSKLWEAYEEWAEATGTKVLKSRKEFGQRLTAKGCWATNSHGKRFWRGVRLRYEDEADPEGDGIR